MASYFWYFCGEAGAAAGALGRVTRDYVEALPWRLPKSYLAGYIHRLAGRPDAAAAEWRRSQDVVARRLAAQPTNSTDLYYKAELHALLGEWEAAEAALKTFEQFEAQQPTFNLLTWQAYAELDREEQVADVCTRELKRGGGGAWGMSISPYAAFFRFHSALDRYRERPRFREIAAEVDRLFAASHARSAPAAVKTAVPASAR